MPVTVKAFRAVRPGHVYPETIPAGEDVTGRLAEIAEQVGALEPEPEPETAAKKPRSAPETKG